MPDYRRRRPRILWGADGIYALDIGQPLESPNGYSLPRAGSEEVQLRSGVEDASDAGDDFILAGTVRHIPLEDTLEVGGERRASGWNGPRGWDTGLRWLRRKGIGYFCPDSRNLLRDPSIDVVHPSPRWPMGTGGTVTAAIANNDDAARVTASSAPGAASAYLTQHVGGIIPGESLSLTVEFRTASEVGTVSFQPAIEFYSATHVYLGAVSGGLGTSAGWVRTAPLTGIAPAGTAYAKVVLYALLTSAGSSCIVWWRNAVLARRTADTAAFLDNPVMPFYLVEPMRTPPGPDVNWVRQVALQLRAANGMPFEGY